MALTGCTPPAKGSPIFELADDEIEMGIGIHGAPAALSEFCRIIYANPGQRGGCYIMNLHDRPIFVILYECYLEKNPFFYVYRGGALYEKTGDRR